MNAISFSRRDFAKLRKVLCNSLLALGASGLIAFWQSLAAQNDKQQWQEATQRLAQLEQHSRQRQADLSDTADNARQIQSWLETGLLGDETRLAWSELLEQLQRELRLPGMEYTFAAQQLLDEAEPGPYVHFFTPLHLQLRLLHEEDLLDFLTRLQDKAPALLLVRSCKLAPIAGPSSESATAPAQLSADCTLQWITIHEKPAKAGAKP